MRAWAVAGVEVSGSAAPEILKLIGGGEGGGEGGGGGGEGGGAARAVKLLVVRPSYDPPAKRRSGLFGCCAPKE